MVPTEKNNIPIKHLVWYLGGTITEVGGGERLILEGLHNFYRQGIQANLLLHENPQDLSILFGGEYTEGLSITIFEDEKTDSQPKKLIEKVKAYFKRAHKLIDTVLKLNPDVIIANSQSEGQILWIASLLTRRKLPPRVTFVHGSPFQFAENITKYAWVFRRHFREIREEDPVYREVIPPKAPPMPFIQRLRIEVSCFLNYLSLRSSSFLFTHSEKNQREISLLYGHRNVIVVSAGGFSRKDFVYRQKQNMKEFYGLADQYVILSICRLVPKKRVDLAIKAYAELLKNNPSGNFIFVIGGSGPHKAELQTLCEELKIQDKVRFIGYVPEANLRDWYCSCDVFISTDNADHDLSIAMAWPLGCKTVITNQYSIPLSLVKTRRFIFAADPTPISVANSIACAVNSDPCPLDAQDYEELGTLSWENYFETILQKIKEVH